MLKIAICDDKDAVRQTVKESVEKYLSKTNLLYEIDTFASCEELLELGIEAICYSIIFLDINKQHFVTARKLREFSSEVQIIFLAEDTANSLEGYKVGAVRYLIKDDVLEAAVYECMDAVFDRIYNGVTRKVFKFNECEKKVSLDRILYIESRLHVLEFHIMEDRLVTYTLYGTLKELEKEMYDFHFLRIHQSFLVNLKHVKSISGYKMVLNNNQVLMIPKTRYRDVKNAVMGYMEKGDIVKAKPL